MEDRTELITALEQADLEAATRLLQINPVWITPDLWFPAIKSGSPELCDLLLKAGLDPNESGADRPPLHFAAYHGQEAIAEWMVAAGADVNKFDGERLTPLDTLHEYGAVVDSPGMVSLFINAGTTLTFWTSVRAGLADKVQAFLDADPTLVNTPAPDAMARTPLMLASQCGHVNVVKLLLDRGAEVNAVDQVACGALYYAAEGRRQGRGPLVNLLLKAGAEVNAVERRGVAPLHQASAWGHADVVAELLEGGADKSLAFGDGKTALDLAKRSGHEDVVRLLELV